VFGAGFGAVLPKCGGLAEIAQVACRAGAVGGGVYVLKKGIKSCSSLNDGITELVLSEGEKITTSWLVGCPDDIPAKSSHVVTDGLTKGIFIVTPALATLFPPTSEGGVTPAGAVVAIPASDPEDPPVHIIAHSHESGECPSSQSKFHLSPTAIDHMMILRKTYLHCLIYFDYKLSTFLTRSIFSQLSSAIHCIRR
jgi:RAB protein geranylgeranyltransferase component A